MAQAIRAVPSQNFLQKTLGAQLLAGVTAAATLNSVTGIQNLPGIFIVDRVNSAGDETVTKREVIKYTAVSGSTLTTLTRNADGGGTDQDHAIGAVVEFVPDVLWAQSIYDALTATVVASTGLIDTTKVTDTTSTQMLFNKMATGATLASPSITVGSDAVGDIYYRGANKALNRLPLGSNGQFLTANASLPVWAGGAGASLTRTPFQVIADASTMYVDFSLGTKFMSTVVPSAARTFLATNATVGDVAMLRVQYASTASFSLTLLAGAGATISWPGGTAPTPTATVGKADLFGFEVNATIPKIDGIIMGQNI